METSPAPGKAMPKTPPSYTAESCEEKPYPLFIDAVCACLFVIMGFFFWEWQLLSLEYAGVGTTLFFLLTLGISAVYLHRKGKRQNTRSLIALGVATVGALPFFIYGARDINTLLLLFEIAVCLMWVALTCKTSLASYLSGTVAMDLINQFFIVPLVNGIGMFSALVRGLQAPKKLSNNLHKDAVVARRRNHRKTILITLAVLVAFVPIMLLLVTLLATSDKQFNVFLQTVLDWLNIFKSLDFYTAWQWIIHFVLGIPVACYLFGSLYGNIHRRYIDTFSQDKLEASYAKAQRLAPIALALPLILLVMLYGSYFLVMAPYLFSAFTGMLPEGFTYAEYARQGFFELCGVAVITLCVLYLTCLLAKRTAGAYPLILRILGGVVALLTILLVVTATSKMALYIHSYGLSPLRMYTTWFMLLLFVSFVLIVLWHARPFNVALPLIIVMVALTCALAFTNTDGIIARYNANRYISGQTTQIDVTLINSLSDAALPALYDLETQARDSEVREEVHDALMRRAADSYAKGQKAQWYNWNITTASSQPPQ